MAVCILSFYYLKKYKNIDWYLTLVNEIGIKVIGITSFNLILING